MVAFTQVIKSRSKTNDNLPGTKQGPIGIEPPLPIGRDSSGIALFIVLAAIGVLSMLVTEFTYVAQITQSIAFGSLDQVKAHYMAKSALKLSLLRLKAYQIGKKNYGDKIPADILNKIWSFPFIYPLSQIPGMSQIGKDAISKFEKESGFEGGSYSAKIESESSKYNLNLLLGGSYLPKPSPSPTPNATPNATPNGTLSGQPQFDALAARQGLVEYLNGIFLPKTQSDPEFGDNRRNFRLEDLVDNISAWVDRSNKNPPPLRSDNKIPFKKAPFYALTELHMVQTMDDELYNLFGPSLTTATTQGINANTIGESVLRALLPDITAEEVTDFFKNRDDPETGKKFATPDDFFKYLKTGIVKFSKDSKAFDDFKTKLVNQNITIVVDESQFKITINATVNNTYRTIEAWVDLSSSGTSALPPLTNGAPPPPPPPVPPGGRVVPDAGLKITFMKIY